MKRLVYVAFAGSLSLAGISASVGQETPKPSTTLQLPPSPLLPQSFKNWTAADPQKTPALSTDLGDDLKKEFILKREATQGYQRGDQVMTVHAEQFVDATGAYAAFTALRKPEMKAPPVKIGSDSLVRGDQAIFWSGPTLVQVSAKRLDPAALQDLAVGLPKIGGPAGKAPSLPSYFPKTGLQAESQRYAVGPSSYRSEGGTLPADLIDFSKSPEIATAQYAGASGNGTVTLIYYPTPQIAGDRARSILAYLQKTPPEGARPESIAVKREGPIVAITSGGFSAEQAANLLRPIRYETNITWNKPEGYISEASKAARLVVGIILGVFAIAIAAFVLGLFFGGGRALVRVLRGKPASTMHDSEFIHLDLRQGPPDANPRAG